MPEKANVQCGEWSRDGGLYTSILDTLGMSPSNASGHTGEVIRLELETRERMFSCCRGAPSYMLGRGGLMMFCQAARLGDVF